MNKGCLTIKSFLLTVISLIAAPVHAQGFSAYVTPPRVEARVQAGETLRQVIEIQHAGRARGTYRFYTNDWSFTNDRSVQFQDALSPDSCRPWVAIERRELALDMGDKYRFRFEISPPAETEPRECRFALMVEGMEPAKVQSAVSIPVGGRIAVIVYVAIGSAKPELMLHSIDVEQSGDRRTLFLTVYNAGNAHGRLEGFIDAKPARGNTVELSPVDTPILAGETRRIPLILADGDSEQALETLQLPINLKGRLEWNGGTMPVDVSLMP